MVLRVSVCYGGRRIVAMVAEAITPIAFALIWVVVKIMVPFWVP